MSEFGRMGLRDDWPGDLWWSNRFWMTLLVIHERFGRVCWLPMDGLSGPSTAFVRNSARLEPVR
ncbi:MAG TPA: hypothetical protein DCE39_01050 [Planctomycetaceae bacterium]|nr:hypothetical protein [Planctomycetaceae bacterium]